MHDCMTVTSRDVWNQTCKELRRYLLMKIPNVGAWTTTFPDYVPHSAGAADGRLHLSIIGVLPSIIIIGSLFFDAPLLEIHIRPGTPQACMRKGKKNLATGIICLHVWKACRATPLLGTLCILSVSTLTLCLLAPSPAKEGVIASLTNKKFLIPTVLIPTSQDWSPQ